MLPPELQKPAPRDVSGDIFKKNSSAGVKAYVGIGMLILLLFMMRFVNRFGTTDIFPGILTGLGITAFFLVFIFALQFNAKRTLKFYALGEATEGIVKVIGTAGNNKYMMVEFKNYLGQTISGQSNLIPDREIQGRKAGDSVAVVYLKENTRMFGIYFPGKGLVSGAVKNKA
jgi:hypothetical protein